MENVDVEQQDSTTPYEVIVIGGGVVGLSILRTLTLAGYSCALVEKEQDLLVWASGTNSGIVCTGVDASPNTLERALLRDSISQLRGFCRKMGIPTRECGSLVCLWPWDEQDRLDEVLQESHDAGDMHACRLSPEEVQSMEANLDPSCTGAVHIPGEIVVDPWLFSISYAVQARENGAHIFTNFEVDPDLSSFNGEIWTVVARRRDGVDDDGQATRSLQARAIVNATGLWADLVQQEDPPPWIAKPRRGQYRIFSSNDETKILHPIQPVPTQRTKGIFVFSSLYDQIIVGPTALDQDSRTDRSIDSEVGEQLAEYARRVIPGLQPDASFVGEYVGLRPGTDKRDYQIHLDVRKSRLACAGIRSTGLSASLGIGRHAVNLLQQGVLPARPPLGKVQCTALPKLEELVSDFHRRGEGTVEINGYVYKVTHPITIFGWQKQSGIAKLF